MKKTIFIILGLITAMELAVHYKNIEARKLVKNFCSEIKVGEPTSGIEEKAKSMGLDEVYERQQHDGKNHIVALEKSFVFNRYTCFIETESGAVVKATAN